MTIPAPVDSSNSKQSSAWPDRNPSSRRHGVGFWLVAIAFLTAMYRFLRGGVPGTGRRSGLGQEGPSAFVNRETGVAGTQMDTAPGRS